MNRKSTREKIEQIQYQFQLGKTKAEVAKSLGYKNVEGLYKFASRHNLKWDNERNSYSATGNDGESIEAVKLPADNPTGKVSNIISMFEGGLDGREIAKRLRFENIQEMADYMKSKGYEWNSTKQNY